MATNAQSSSATDLTGVFAAASSRIDQWNQLNALARAWTNAVPKSEQADKLHADISKQLAAITRIEYCWAYPGPRMLAAVVDALERRDPTGFARLVQKVSSALLSSDFRRDESVWDTAAESTGQVLDAPSPVCVTFVASE